MIRFKCPSCLKTLKAPDHGAGRKVSCPRCDQQMLIPSVPAVPPPAKPTVTQTDNAPMLEEADDAPELEEAKTPRKK
jgi:hypothetical protein